MTGWAEVKVSDLVVGARMLVGGMDCPVVATVTRVVNNGALIRIEVTNADPLHEEPGIEVWARLPEATK